MDTTTSAPVDTGAIAGAGAILGTIPDLVDYSGRVGIEVGGEMAAAFQITRGQVELTGQSDQPVDAVIALRALDDLRRMIRGELNAVVAALRARLAVRGNGALAIKVIRGLHANAVAAADAAQNGA